ncbi:hypothetical protein HPB47_016302, partial [Ixodes persulcatus]
MLGIPHQVRWPHLRCSEQAGMRVRAIVIKIMWRRAPTDPTDIPAPRSAVFNEYAAIVTKLTGKKASVPAQSQEAAAVASSGVEGLVTTVQDGAFIIRFNRPSKRNSITLEIFEEVIKLLKDARQRDDVKFLVLTGTGEVFSSGLNLGHFPKQMQEWRSQEELAKKATELLSAVGEGGVNHSVVALFPRRYVAEFINFPKPAIALINGPSIGACEVLMMNTRLSAKEAQECGFVSECFPDASFQEETQKKIQEMAKLPAK